MLNRELFSKNMRDAHEIVGKIIIYCEEQQKPIEKLRLDELLLFSPTFTDEIFEYIEYERILLKGTKREMVQV